MIVVLASFRLPAAHLPRARDLIPGMVAITRAEAGCQAYAVAEDVLDAGLFRISELWDTTEHLATHLDAPHMAAWGKARAAMGMTERQLKVFAIDREVTL